MICGKITWLSTPLYQKTTYCIIPPPNPTIPTQTDKSEFSQQIRTDSDQSHKIPTRIQRCAVHISLEGRNLEGE